MTLLTHRSMRSSGPSTDSSLPTRLANAPVAYAAYLGQSFYPADLSPYYPHPGTHLPTARSPDRWCCCWRSPGWPPGGAGGLT